MLNRIQTPDGKPFDGAKILVYGAAGLGKTMLVATLPSPLLISAEGGDMSLRTRNLETVFGYGRADITYHIPMIEIRNVNDLMDVYRWLTSSPESNQFASIAIDSLTEVAEIVLKNAKAQVKDPRQAYNEVLEKTMETVRKFRDLSRHVLVTTHAAQIKDELTGIVKQGPSFPGQQLGPKLPHHFDFVCRIGVQKIESGPNAGQYMRFLQTQPDLQNIGKSRCAALNTYEEAHLGKMIHTILSTGLS